MNEEDVLKNNELIAEFITDEPEVLRKDLFKAGCVESMRYHESWDWLMPVVEKIELLGVSTDIHYFAATKKHSNGYFGTEFLGYIVKLSKYDNTNQYDSKIKAVYNAVINFINWYNKQ